MKIKFSELKVGDKFSKFEMYVGIPHYTKLEEWCSECNGGNLNVRDEYSGEIMYVHPSRDVYVPDEEDIF
jgi:hypothetical protein